MDGKENSSVRVSAIFCVSWKLVSALYIVKEAVATLEKGVGIQFKTFSKKSLHLF
jgi:hypothetical protein